MSLQLVWWRSILIAASLATQFASHAHPANDKHRTVLLLGDSLSAAFGMPPEKGWAALMATRITEQKPGWSLTNGSISGLGSEGGAERIVELLAQHDPEVVVIALGANDALRKLPASQLRGNLARIIDFAQAADAEVLLIGGILPPHFEFGYAEDFAESYSSLKTCFNLVLLPHLLEPIAGDPDAFQADHLHPTAEAQPLIRDHVWQALAPLLD